MTEKTGSTPESAGTEVTLVTPMESKHWEIVQGVAELQRKGYDTVSACRELGIATSTYYRALHSPYVQEQRLEQIQAMKAASVTIVERNWSRILNNMAGIARSGDSKEAVQAARFVRDVYKDLERDAEELAQEGQDSALALFAERLKGAPGKKTFRAKRSRKRGDSRVVEEVEVEIPGVSDG